MKNVFSQKPLYSNIKQQKAENLCVLEDETSKSLIIRRDDYFYFVAAPQDKFCKGCKEINFISLSFPSLCF